jgi:hypothetical protein
MLALLNLSIRDVTPMIHGSFLDIQPLALGFPEGAVFHTQVTVTNRNLDRNCGNAGTGLARFQARWLQLKPLFIPHLQYE